MPLEMLHPYRASWVKQFDGAIRLRVDARKVWTFVTIAETAGPSQILGLGSTAVLPSDDVVEVKWQFGEAFRKVTIFAPMLGPHADEVGQHLVHSMSLSGGVAE
jgi:hypothetical protein